MLSRVAESLFWIGRYMERAENVARLIDTARRMVTLPNTSGRETTNEWSSILIASGASQTFQHDLKTATREDAVAHLVYDRDNPSSIYNSIRNARENARAIRFGLTSEVWTALNSAHSDFKKEEEKLKNRRAYLAEFVDWVKASKAQYRGSVEGTLVRDDSLQFIRLGSYLERGDATARILDVKYHVLLPTLNDLGGGLDQYQWVSLLQGVGVLRAYHFVTKKEITRDGVAQFLIQNEINPRSLAFCISQAVHSLTDLEARYGMRHPCNNTAEAMLANLRSADINTILADGLHEFITAFIGDVGTLSQEIATSFAFAPPVSGPVESADDSTLAQTQESDAQAQSQSFSN